MITLAGSRDVTVEDYISLATNPEFALSGDGQFVAYCEARWDTADDKRKTDLWVVATDGKGKPTRLTGEPVYAGKAVATEYGLDGVLHTVRAPGSAPVAVRARLSDDGLEITGISARVAEEPTQTPQRLASPEHS